ncbi:hypothetical protein BVRB_1g018220 isoform B [Beta vulgaris subsp. vulgaris]|nr:hypothetical protein BVRB_1g018220 isoform B [Beta vulgaris subsp. vulgaris]
MSQPQSARSNNTTRNLSRWSVAEDRALITAMTDLLDIGGWKADNGQFKSGAYAKLETIMLQKLPGCEKKAKPHIESRVKHLRKQYDAITEMLSPSASGFGWNDEEKFVTCPQAVWDEWIKSHKNAAGLRNKPFPFYEELGKIWGKDRAVGNESGTVYDVLQEMEHGARVEEEHQVPDLNAEESNSPTQCDPTGPPSSTPQSTTPSSSRTKRARTETIEALKEFSTKIGKISDVMEAATEHIGRLANCFQHESDSADRRMKLTTEIMKMEGLSPSEVLLASKKIALNPLEVDFFFSLPENFKYAYVQGLLLPDQ